MCFSPTASFAASAVLTSTGSYCVRESVRGDRRYLPLALLPLLFGVQQAAEGGVWLALEGGHARLVAVFSSLFLFFAFGLWPFYCPLIVHALEGRGTARRKVLLGLMVAGGIVGGLVYLPLVLGTTTFTARVVNACIAYETVRPGWLKGLYTGAYLLVTMVPFLIASSRRIVVFGAMLVAAVVATMLSYRFAFFSVWCFFAAWLSTYVLYAVRRSPAPA
ncbi:MAG: hypothetical protein QM704_14350 [Anaeromyxobacteraceae bacterium]